MADYVVGRTGSRDGPAAHHIHHGSLVDQRREGTIHPLGDVRPPRIGDVPLRAVEQIQQICDIADEHQAVAAIVGMPRVLDERAIDIEAIPGGHVGEYRTEIVHRQGDLGGISTISPRSSAFLHLSARFAPVDTVLTIMIFGLESNRSTAAI